MKIEKLTDNKIRVIMNFKDIELDKHDFFENIIDSQSLFVDILEKAEKEVDFHTEGCKLLIEAFSTFEDVIVFTITKFSVNDNNLSTNNKKKKVIVKRKTNTPLLNNAIYEFDNFDSFCDFCKSITNILDVHTEKIAKKVLLYNYNNKNTKRIFNTLSEFAKIQNFSNNFEFKLLEHGNLFVKNNAILKGIKYLI